MEDRIRKIMAESFECPVEQITERTNQDSIDNWDSLHHVKLIVLLEREFDIEVPDESVGNMISFKLIKTVIDGCLS